MGGTMTTRKMARMFFPDSDRHSYLKEFLQWIIEEHKEMYEKLTESGFTPETKTLSPLHINILFTHLGKPWLDCNEEELI